MEIERRKEEIFNEYQKRNSGIHSQKDEAKNKKMRKEYEQSLKSKKSPQHRQGQGKKEEYDPYRQVYRHQPSKDPKQLGVIGDPLMHQYEYQKNVGKLKVM